MFDLNVLDDLADEDEAKAMDYPWEKINGEFEQLEKFHHSYNLSVHPRKIP
jgi:hypothetical protein